jgi:histidine triad (HIT) family protein
MTAECLFCRIATHTSAAHILYEDDLVMSFLVLCPIRPGHALIIPKQHFDYFEDVPVELITPIILLGQKIAFAMKALYGVPRAAFLFTGGDLPHVHAHVVPLHEKEDITSRQYIAERNLTFREVARVPDADLAAEAAKLVQTLSVRS